VRNENMIKYLIKTICLAIFLPLFITPGLCWADYDYIDINNPFLRKIPIAIPVFSSLPDSKTKKLLNLQVISRCSIAAHSL